MLNKITLYDFKTEPMGNDFIAQLKLVAHQIHVVLADNDYAGALTSDDLKNSEALVTRVFDNYPNEMFEGTAIKYIGSTHTDVSDFDLIALNKKGITLTHVPSYCAQTIAELTFGVLLSIARQLPAAFNHTKQNKWNFQPFLGFELAGKKLGLIGMGKIGKRMVRIAQGFDMDVSYYSRTRKPEMEKKGVSFSNLPDLVSNSDILSIHTTLNKETSRFLDEDLLNRFQSNGIILNPSRAELIDFDAVYKKCLESEITLWIDELHDSVWRNKFRNLDNVLMTPDFGWYTIEAQNRLKNITIQNIKSYAEGKIVNKI
ncbi:MAG: glyoxylate reductase [Flavobacterium sp.]|jgi:glyoxylate reductase